MSGEVRRFLCHRVVEHIKGCGEVLFDTLDLEEDLEGVLESYDWYLTLSEEEKELIRGDLFDLALRHEVSEVARSMNVDDFLSEEDVAVLFAERDPAAFGVEPVLADK